MSVIEFWVPVTGYEGLYSVSNCGRVRRDSRASGTQSGYILNPTIGSTGYFQVGLSNKARHRTKKVHRLVAEAFLGPSPCGLQVNHKDGVKTNNAIWNLEYVTPAQNTQHAATVLGAMPRGESHRMSKLTETEVRTIRELTGQTLKQIANAFGVSEASISLIRRGKNWRHVA